MTYMSRLLAFMRVEKAETLDTPSPRALVRYSHWMSLLLMVMCTYGLSTACLLPPDSIPPMPSYSPTFRLANVSPRESIISTRLNQRTDETTDCFITFGVTDIVDADSPDLRARLVLNNGLEGSLVLLDKLVVNGEFNETISAIRLGLLEGEPSRISIVSLFLSDGDNWVSAAQTPPSPFDYGQDENIEAEIVEVRWTIRFDQGADCRGVP